MFGPIFSSFPFAIPGLKEKKGKAKGGEGEGGREKKNNREVAR